MFKLLRNQIDSEFEKHMITMEGLLVEKVLTLLWN